MDVISDEKPFASSSSGHLANRSARSEISALERFLISVFVSSIISSFSSSGAFCIALANADTLSEKRGFCNVDCHPADFPLNNQAL